MLKGFETVPQVPEGGVDLSQASDDNLAEDAGMTIMTIIEVLITWGDQVLDVIVLAQMLSKKSPYGPPILAILVFGNVCQALSSHFFQRNGALSSVAALFGLKPLVDGAKVVFHIKTKDKFDAQVNFAHTRVVEAAFESIPQAIIQALVLAADVRSTAQYISLSWSILSERETDDQRRQRVSMRALVLATRANSQTQG